MSSMMSCQFCREDETYDVCFCSEAVAARRQAALAEARQRIADLDLLSSFGLLILTERTVADFLRKHETKLRVPDKNEQPCQFFPAQEEKKS